MKKHISIFCAFLIIFTLFAGTSAFAAQTYRDGTSVVFHNASPYFIVDGRWIEGEYYTEYNNGTLFASIEDFKVAFKCNVIYNAENNSVSTFIQNRTLWQAVGYDTLFVDSQPFTVAAPYISSVEGNPVMIPIEAYASTVGYVGTWSQSESYPPGQLSLEAFKFLYTITGVEVNQAAQLVTVYGKTPWGEPEPIKHMLCSTGLGNSTPNGTYGLTPLGTDWYYFPTPNCFVRYCTQISGNICFHSLTFNEKTIDSLSRTAYKNIGQKASSGCIRLFVDDAKFIHQNCRGLRVTITPGYENAVTDAIRTQIIKSKHSYEEYVYILKYCR